jgi:hypothetical protein
MTPDIYRIWLKNSVVDVNNPPDFSHLDSLYNRLIENIRDENYFSFMKMGDGDILAYFHHPIIHTTMSDEYRKIFSKTLQPLIEHKISTNDPKIILGIENNTPFFKVEQFEDHKWPAEKILDFFEKLKHTDSLKNNCMVFSYIYAKEGLVRLFKSLSDKNVILVGPEYLKRINIESRSINYVVTPVRNSWEIQSDIEKDLDEKISLTKDPIIIYACSVTGKMALAKMYFKYPDITQIDIGANLDPYAGAGCRPWHPKIMKL